jgi:chitin disaccharide deacetylase
MAYTANLKIIADDLGLHEKVNEGIILGLKNGWINGASIMANGDAYEDAIERLKEISNPNVGIHLVLVEENPLSNKDLVKSLVSKNGKFFKNHKVFFLRYILGMISNKDIELELRTQIDKVRESGVKINFINSHQHLHLLPGIMDIVIRLAKEYDISYIRTVREPIGGLNPIRVLQLCFLRFLSNKAKISLERNGLKTNDFFFGFLNAGNLNRKTIIKARKFGEEHKDMMIELGTHPGYEDDDLRMKYKSWGSYNWQKELDLLR